jgi:DNA-binding NarL/FixJ family response regulator
MVQARDLEARGWPRKTIARRLGIDERTVRFWLGPSRIGQSEAARRSYVLRIGPSRYREQVARVLELRTAGGTYEGIAAELGISWHRVRRHCLEADLGGRRGAQRARKSALRAPQSAPGSDA